jgi:hypothetical protein
MESSNAGLAAEISGNSNSTGRINDLGKRVKNARELSGTADDAAL